MVLPLENQMRTPRDMRGWNGVLNTSMTIVTCLYIAVGFFGYLKYGEDVQGSITLNLPVDQWYVCTFAELHSGDIKLYSAYILKVNIVTIFISNSG